MDLTTDDTDYVDAMRTLVAVQAKINSQGPRSEYLLRRAIVLLALKDPLPAGSDAEEVYTRHPENTEALYVRGQAYLMLAITDREVLHPGGEHYKENQIPPKAALLKQAHRAFNGVIARNPNDQDAKDSLEIVKKAMA